MTRIQWCNALEERPSDDTHSRRQNRILDRLRVARRPEAASALGLADVELLDAVIVGIDDVQMPVTVDRQAVRGQELAGFASLLFAETAQVAAVAGDLLNPAAGGADPQAVFPV